MLNAKINAHAKYSGVIFCIKQLHSIQYHSQVGDQTVFLLKTRRFISHFPRMVQFLKSPIFPCEMETILVQRQLVVTNEM